MAYNARADNQWRSPTGGYQYEEDDDFLGEMANQTPQHPIPTMQGAFEESMLETINDEDEPIPMTRKDSVYRRKVLLERPQYERRVAGKWKQRAGEKYHPLWKIVAQISFGMHLLHQGLAKSDEEVMKILQNHVDEVDGFLERTTDDFDLAQADINERIRYLSLPLEHGDVFDSMLGDRAFRAAMVEGNIKIEHIIDRTQIALTDSLKDVKKGSDGTRELAKYLRKLQRTWQPRDEGHADVFVAMIGNTEGWSGAFLILQDNGKKLNESLEYLRGIISEIQKLVGIASRRDVPKPFIPKSQASSISHSKKGGRRTSLSPPRSPGGSHEFSNTEQVMKPQTHVNDGESGDRTKRKEPSGRSKPQIRYAKPSIAQHVDARSQLPSRRASFSDRTHSISQKLSIRSPSKDETANEIRAARAYPQTAVEPKSAPWAFSSKDHDGLSSRQRKTQSMISPHTPYDLDYILHVTPSDTTISPMRDSELAGLRSATNQLISPMSEILGPRTAPLQPRPPPGQFTPQPLQPRTKRISTIQENTSNESFDRAGEQSVYDSSLSESLLKDMETTKHQISQAAAVRPLKPAARELPLRDYREQNETVNGTGSKAEKTKPNIRASSVYSRTTDLKSMFSPPQEEKDNLMALLRKNTEMSIYDTDGPPSAYTEGTLSPPPAGSSAKPSPLNLGGGKPSQFSEKAPNLEPRFGEEGNRNEDLFPPRGDSRLALSHPTQEGHVSDGDEEHESGNATSTTNPSSPNLAALTSATVTGPEPDFPFLSATVNGPEPGFPFDTPPAAQKASTEASSTTKHPELIQRIAAATQAESSSSSSPPKASVPARTKLSEPPPVAPAGEFARARRRDVPPNLNLKLFPPPDQYARATSPRSPRQIALRPLAPEEVMTPGRSITPIGQIHPNNVSNPTLLTVPYGDAGPEQGRSQGQFAANGHQALNFVPAPNIKPKSPSWRRVFSPGILTGKLRNNDKDKSGRKGHKRGGGSGDGDSGNGSRGGGNGSNGRITPLIGDPMLKGSTVALPQLGGDLGTSSEGVGRPGSGSGSGRPSAEGREGPILRGPGGDGQPF